MGIKVKLEILNNSSPFIKAPEFCPYKETVKVVEGIPVYGVPSVLCPLCRKCDFTTEDISEGITRSEQEKIVKYLTQFNTKIASSISGQRLYLTKEDRLPLMILINISLFEQCLQYACENNKKRIEEIKSHTVLNETPICYIIGCPVVLSNKLTKSQIQVVGEIQWK